MLEKRGQHKIMLQLLVWCSMGSIITPVIKKKQSAVQKVIQPTTQDLWDRKTAQLVQLGRPQPLHRMFDVQHISLSRNWSRYSSLIQTRTFAKTLTKMKVHRFIVCCDGRRSFVYPSAPSILRPQVQIPNKTSMLRYFNCNVKIN